jgi:hypothetical protein
MDPLELLHAKERAKCVGVHHQIQKDGYHDDYFSQEPKCTPQVFGGSTKSFSKANDDIQSKYSLIRQVCKHNI